MGVGVVYPRLLMFFLICSSTKKSENECLGMYAGEGACSPTFFIKSEGLNVLILLADARKSIGREPERARKLDEPVLVAGDLEKFLLSDECFWSL